MSIWWEEEEKDSSVDTNFALACWSICLNLLSPAPPPTEEVVEEVVLLKDEVEELLLCCII